MTEYDYSPDAYKRYLATQQRITRWAENTSRYRPSNPFVASPTSGDSSQNSSFYKDSSRSSDSNHSKIRHRSTSDATLQRPEPSRSYTAPAPVQRSSADQSRTSSQSRSTHHSRRSSHSSTSRHTSRSNRSRATSSSVKTVTPNADGPTYVKRSNSQSILVPIDGGRYVIIPPKGTRLEVMDQSAEDSRSKDKKAERPLFQRLLSSFRL